MAVPIPGRGNRTNGVQGYSDTQGFRLEYPGKKSAAVILATPAGRYEPDSTYVGGDNVAMCSTAHPQIYGGTLANKPSVDVDLSEQAIEDAIIGIMGLTDARGLLIKLMPRSLHVPRQEWFNANRILKSIQQSGTANNDLNILRVTNALPEGIKVNHYFSSAHAWFIRTMFAAEQGLIYQERTKVQFDQDNDFDTKNAKAASFERYVFGWGDWRSVWGVNGP